MSTAYPLADRAGLIRALGVLCERPGPGTNEIAAALHLPTPSAAEHTELFLQQLPPYASIYLDREGKIGGEARDRVAGFWRALRMSSPSEPDHLTALFGLWATIGDTIADETDPERRSLLEHAQRTLVWEHLASWLSPYLTRVAELSPETYGHWAQLVLAVFSETVGDDPEEEAPVHLALPRDEFAGQEDLIPFLLAPIRSGVIITRSDLSRAATALGLGMRLGERAFSLRSLLGQARRPVLTWLAGEAARQAQVYAAGLPAAIADVWSSRAEDTSETLRRTTPQS